MTRARLLVLLPVLGLLMLIGASPVLAATSPADVAASFQSGPVFVEGDAEAAGKVDGARVRDQISASSRAIYVAVLPQRAATSLGSAGKVAIAIAQRVSGPAVVVVLVGDQVTAASTPGTGLEAGQAASVVSSVSGDATERLVQAVRNLQQVQVTAGGGGGADTGGGGNGGIILGVLAVAALGGGGLFLRRSRRQRMQALEGQRADVESLYHRLGSDVSTLAAGDDPLVRQAMADAAERYNATGALLSQADTPGEYSAARRTAVEGLIAARTARVKLGLDPGPEIPAPPGAGPQLTEAQKVTVGDQEYDGSPSYEPGRGHYFGGGYYGGRYVPGGWYGIPFWETMVLSSVLSGGFGGGGGGDERGYDAGQDDSRRDHDGGWGSGDTGGGWSGGGGWGGGGGGDTGGGSGGGNGGSW